MEILASRSLAHFIRLATFVLIVAILYWGRGILVPLVLAALFTFMLGPLVKWLCRKGLPRPLSVLMVTLVVFSTLAVILWLLGREAHHLAAELPAHRQNIHERVKAVQSVGENGVILRLRELMDSLTNPDPAIATETATGAPPPEQPPAGEGSQAKPEGNGLLSRALNFMLSTLADALGTAGLVVLFVVFMLLRQEDIAHRIVRLVGYSRLTVTTKAVDESGRRISRYLLTQFSINSVYGLLLAGGLAFIGLPYIALWGVLAALFRFIPYVGPWMVAILPVSLSLAVFDGWSQPLQVIALIATLELVTNMLVEPVLYGHSVGVADFSLLLAITFWTWLWGGIGLLLATPLTVCLVVFAKYLPAFGWVEILMGEKVAAQTHLQLYQRILADDEDAAVDLIQRVSEEKGTASALDRMALPALAMARREVSLGRLDKPEEEEFYQAMRSAVALLKNDPDKDSDEAEPAAPPLKIMARALRGEADQLALWMLAQALGDRAELSISMAPQLMSEWVEKVVEEKPALVCISAMPPGAQLAAAVLCRRLRERLPDSRLIVCPWSLPEQELDPRALKEAGANWVTGSIRETVEVIRRELV